MNLQEQECGQHLGSQQFRLINSAPWDQVTSYKQKRRTGVQVERFAFELLRDAEEKGVTYNSEGHQVVLR